MFSLFQERMLIGIGTVASAEWQFEITRAYLKQRKAFGKTLANLQVNCECTPM